MAETATVDKLPETPLGGLHRELGARMVGFAGYSMPVQYPTGIIAEHTQVRVAAGLFDVSHMGQAVLSGPDHETTARAVEALTPGDFVGLGLGRVRYTLLTTDAGGIIDDLMVARSISPDDDGRLMLVVNAARKDVDYEHLRARLPAGVTIEPAEDRALIALQGPAATAVIARHAPKAADLGFMTAAPFDFDGIGCHISRSGYTGEDGFEISMMADRAEAVARALLAEAEVAPIGLGARDSLRLEAGLCLYGHDIDETTSPVEADLGFAVARRRRSEGGFPGADRVMRELGEGPSRRRVGITLDSRVPAREGAVIADADGRSIGSVTSGSFSPTLGGPIAMGYAEPAASAPGTVLSIAVRGRELAAAVAPLPFVPHRYFRKPAS